MQSRDTTPSAEREQFAILRAMRPDEKLRLMGELCASARYWTTLGLRRRYPNADDSEIRMRLFSTWLPRETMLRCYAWDPGEH